MREIHLYSHKFKRFQTETTNPSDKNSSTKCGSNFLCECIVNKKHFGEPIFVTLPKEIILVFSWNLFKSSFYIFFMTNLS